MRDRRITPLFVAQLVLIALAAAALGYTVAVGDSGVWLVAVAAGVGAAGLPAVAAAVRARR